MISVVRKISFNAAHRLHNPKWDDARNKEVFGLCNNPNYHGHNYTLFVEVTGEIDPETGYLIDLKILKDLVEENVTNQLDHSNLNLDIPYFKDVNPTAENVAIYIWNKVRQHLDSKFVLSVTLYETERNYVIYNGK